ncbi:hypothetical protein EYW49_02130 [Siculibacillus lacustris]|uniref:Uncharacterized protein n=1 Tax=Siculibacillus lacustris TaxID=1549641 RepID=A0A4Q9VX63_9HYPH|nr:hypothetical protein [Siculibacillus lacustris]TBW40977.1 hypothetical protein EYW49_02130 [Siculibacillus lacustris]
MTYGNFAGGSPRRPIVTGLGSIVDTLARNLNSVVLAVNGDSTSAEVVSPGYGFLFSSLFTQLAPLVPRARIQSRLWSDATQTHAPWAVAQAGASGERGISMGTTNGRYWTATEVGSPAGDFLLEVKVALNEWSDAALNRWFLSQWNLPTASGRRLRFGKTTANAIMFEYSLDGIASQYFPATAGAWTVPANGAPTRFRLAYQVNNGAGQRVLTMSQSLDDGATWAQIATTTTAGASAPYASTMNVEVGSSFGAAAAAGSGGMNGTIFEAIWLDGLASGADLLPKPLETARPYFGTDGCAVVGSPTLYLYNASAAQKNIAYHADATRFPKTVPKAWPLVHVLNDGHNEGALVGPSWTAQLAAWATAAKARNPDADLVALTQNPQAPTSPDGYYPVRHLARQAQLPMWCARNGVRCIDTARDFWGADGAVVASLIQADSVHPTLAGDKLRATAILREMAGT